MQGRELPGQGSRPRSPAEQTKDTRARAFPYEDTRARGFPYEKARFSVAPVAQTGQRDAVCDPTHVDALIGMLAQAY